MLFYASTYICECAYVLQGCDIGRLTVVVDDELDTEFRIKAVRKKMRLSAAIEEAIKLWLEKD
jgi:hypothetical protein